MKKEYTFFNNIDHYSRYDEAREQLFMSSADDEWDSPEDIPNERIEKELDFEDDADWSFFEYRMTNMLSDGHYLLTGTCGRWDGPARGGKFIETFRDFSSCIQHLDYLKIYEVDGHLYIEGYHHDGSDHYELKKLTRKGYEYAERNGFAHDGYLHSTLMNFNFYSTLPRLSEYA